MSAKTQTLLSAGIDIGTSTTKMIISRLTLENTAGQTQVPRIEIVAKDIVYKSPIFRTPLLDEVTIDVKKVEQFVFEQYRNANITAQQIETGVVLITGETATKHNARDVIHFLSDVAGEFLVATAGPDLESILAAKGSGAAAYSKKYGKVVANIDIGGGTTNIAVLQHGEVIGTVTLHLGGRLLEYSEGRLVQIAPSMKRLLKQHGLHYELGDKRNTDMERFVIAQMTNSLVEVLAGQQNAEQIPLLLGHTPNWQQHIQAIMFSGGVAQCMYPADDESCNIRTFDDIGQQIAKSLQQSEALQQYEWLKPLETVRATVTGAGTQSTDVSGATIELDASVLPLKNIPVVTCDFQKQLTELASRTIERIRHAVQVYDSEKSGEPFALYLKQVPYLNFLDIQLLAKTIVENWPSNNALILVIVEADYAKVLGQSMMQLKGQKQLVCIDQIYVRTGDYIDIGHQMQTGVVPVVVKTLAFHQA